jgi:hypothetical protein
MQSWTGEIKPIFSWSIHKADADWQDGLMFIGLFLLGVVIAKWLAISFAFRQLPPRPEGFSGCCQNPRHIQIKICAALARAFSIPPPCLTLELSNPRICAGDTRADDLARRLIPWTGALRRGH